MAATATAFLSWKLPGSSTHSTVSPCGFTNCHFPNVLVYMVSTYAESLRDCPVSRWPLWPLRTCKNFRQNLRWVQIFMGATIHENLIFWKFNPRNISSMKISVSTVVNQINAEKGYCYYILLMDFAILFLRHTVTASSVRTWRRSKHSWRTWSLFSAEEWNPRKGYWLKLARRCWQPP